MISSRAGVPDGDLDTAVALARKAVEIGRSCQSRDAGQVRTNYRQNYARLADIERRYDPDNLFRLNQNVPPASTPPGNG